MRALCALACYVLYCIPNTFIFLYLTFPDAGINTMLHPNQAFHGENVSAAKSHISVSCCIQRFFVWIIYVCALVMIPINFATAELTQSAAKDARTLSKTLPGDPELLNKPAVTSWRIGGNFQSNRVIDDRSVPGGKALRVGIPNATKELWDVNAKLILDKGFEAGDIILASLWVRAEEFNNEPQSGVLSSILVETASGPWEGVIQGSALVPDRWTRIYAYDIAKRSYKAGEAALTLHLGAVKQVLDLGPAAVFSLGEKIDLSKLPKNRISYPGSKPDAEWRALANARIEKHRKSPLAVVVKDQSGTPIPSAKVHFRQQRHAYKFGSYTGHSFVDSGVDEQRSREVFAELFNYATAPVYWSDWGWQNPGTRLKYVKTIKKLTEMNIPWRAHTFLYPAKKFVPSKIVALEDRPNAMRQAVYDHMDDILKGLQDLPAPLDIDVTNEHRTGAYLPDIIGDDAIAETYRKVQKAYPNATLFINDFGILNNGGNNQAHINFYHNWIEMMQKREAPIQGIGFQGHFGAALTHPQRVYEVLDQFYERHKLPMQLTEFDIDTDDEETQAAYTRDLLTIIFSHPQTTAFIAWGFWEGDHWRPKGAMYRKDWSAKPNLAAWKETIYRDFWTDRTVDTNRYGVGQLRATHGDYVITVEHNGEMREARVSVDHRAQTVPVVF